MLLKLTLLFFCFSGYTLLLKKTARVPYAAGPATTAGVIIGALFLADFVGALFAVAYFLYAFGIGALIFCLCLQLRIRISPKSWEPLLYTLIIALLYFLLYAFNAFGAFHDWDEFSHWGTVIKVIHDADTFHFKTNALYFQDYPPGGALFSYFVLKQLDYSEGNAYFSYALLVFAFLMPVIGLAKRIISILICGILVFFLVFKFGNGFSSVLIDHILSVMFGGILSSYYLLRRDNAQLWPLSCMLVALALAKHSGQHLALLLGACIVFDLLVCALVNEQKPLLRGLSRQEIRSLICISLIIIFSPIAFSLIWKYHLISSGATTSVGAASLSELIVKSMSCCSNERDAGIVKKFTHHIMGAWSFTSALPFADNISSIDKSRFIARLIASSLAYSPLYLFLTLTVTGCAFACVPKTPKEKIRFFVLTFLLAGGAIAYSAAQLLFYLYVMSDNDARALSSFERFQHSYYLGWALVVIGIGGLLLAEAQSAIRGVTLAAVLVGIPGLWEDRTGTAIVEFMRAGAPQIRPVREPIKHWTSRAASKIPGTASVFVIWQGSNGEHFWYIHHELQPRKTNFDCYSLGPPKYEKDGWSCNLKERGVETLLAKYQFLAVGHGLSDLRTIYPELFGSLPRDTESGLFQIDTSGGNHRMKFKAIPY